MQKKTFADFDCAIAQTLEQIGDWWTLLIVRNAFHRMRNFDQFQENLGIPTNTLSNRLKKLTDSGILVREKSKTDGRSFEYRLTDKGLDLYPVIIALFQWGERWYARPHGPRMTLTEKASGEEIPQMEVLNNKGEVLKAQDVLPTLGPGAGHQVSELLYHHKRKA